MSPPATGQVRFSRSSMAAQASSPEVHRVPPSEGLSRQVQGWHASTDFAAPPPSGSVRLHRSSPRDPSSNAPAQVSHRAPAAPSASAPIRSSAPAAPAAPAAPTAPMDPSMLPRTSGLGTPWSTRAYPAHAGPPPAIPRGWDGGYASTNCCGSSGFRPGGWDAYPGRWAFSPSYHADPYMSGPPPMRPSGPANRPSWDEILAAMIILLFFGLCLMALFGGL
jgi:hypothetical protein